MKKYRFKTALVLLMLMLCLQGCSAGELIKKERSQEIVRITAAPEVSENPADQDSAIPDGDDPAGNSSETSEKDHDGESGNNFECEKKGRNKKADGISGSKKHVKENQGENKTESETYSRKGSKKKSSESSSSDKGTSRKNSSGNRSAVRKDSKKNDSDSGSTGRNKNVDKSSDSTDYGNDNAADSGSGSSSQENEKSAVGNSRDNPESAGSSQRDSSSENEETGKKENENGENTEKCTASISINCKTVLKNMDDLDKSKRSVIPSDGVILSDTGVSFSKGDTVFDLLKSVTRDKNIQMEFEYTPVYNSAYIEGIANLYEFDCGELSGWMYSVNGRYPNYGVSRYKLKDGDRVEFNYTCDLGRDLGQTGSKQQ